jgi:hypothetical protein
MTPGSRLREYSLVSQKKVVHHRDTEAQKREGWVGVPIVRHSPVEEIASAMAISQLLHRIQEPAASELLSREQTKGFYDAFNFWWLLFTRVPV